MIESSPRVHRHCDLVGAAEVPVCGRRADGAQLAAKGSHATMWRRVLRGRDILDRRAASF